LSVSLQKHPYNSIGSRMGAAAPNPGHTFPTEGKYAKVGIGVLRIPPMYPATLWRCRAIFNRQKNTQERFCYGHELGIIS